MDYTYLILLGIIIILTLLVTRNSAKKQTQKKDAAEPISMHEIPEPQPEESGMDYSQSYQAKYLLTKNEWHEYKKLKQYAQGMGLQVCPKVRLLDMIEPRSGIDL